MAFYPETQYQRCKSSEDYIFYLMTKAQIALQNSKEVSGLDPFKEDVFALGISMIYASTFQLKNNQNQSLEEQISKVAQRYSQNFVTLLSQMTGPDSNIPSAIRVYSRANTFYKPNVAPMIFDGEKNTEENEIKPVFGRKPTKLTDFTPIPKRATFLDPANRSSMVRSSMRSSHGKEDENYVYKKFESKIHDQMISGNPQKKGQNYQLR